MNQHLGLPNTGQSDPWKNAKARQRLGFDTAKEHRLLNRQPLARGGGLREMALKWEESDGPAAAEPIRLPARCNKYSVKQSKMEHRRKSSCRIDNNINRKFKSSFKSTSQIDLGS